MSYNLQQTRQPSFTYFLLFKTSFFSASFNHVKCYYAKKILFNGK